MATSNGDHFRGPDWTTFFNYLIDYQGVPFPGEI
jgi:hypothetical protein